MLDYFTVFMDFKAKNKIKLPHIKRYTNQIRKFHGIELENIPNSKGVNFIRTLLGMFDIDKLTKIKNDYERLDYITNTIVPTFQSYLVNNQQNYILKDSVFVNLLKSSTISCPQIILFSMESNYFKYLPMGANEFLLWEDVKPISILHHNSPEFTIDISSGLFLFFRSLPDYVIIEIDIVMLLMQYSKYLILEKYGTISEFIKKYCILPLVDDMKNIWLMNFIYDIINLTISTDSTYYDSKIYKEIKTRYIDLNFAKYNFLKTELKSAINDIINVIMLCTVGKLQPERILYSIPSVTSSSLIEYIKYMNDKYYIERNNNNTWVLFLKDLYFINLLLSVFALNPNYSKTKELIVYFRPIILRYESNNFWSFIKDPIFRAFVKDKFQELKEKISKIKSL